MYDGEMQGLYHAAREALKFSPVAFDLRKAELVLEQLIETATHRKWRLSAVSIMATHFHAVIHAPHEIDPDRLLGDLKAWASRKLNRTLGDAVAEEWWTEGGSKRPLYDDAAILDAIEYTLFKQADSLVVWCAERGRLV